MRRDLDLLPRCDLVTDSVAELLGKRPVRSVDRLGLRVERVHVRGVSGYPERESAVAATHLEYAAAAEVAQPSQGGEMSAFGVEHGSHRASDTVALYALRVVPRAPNFFALRRVSSNVERE